MPLRSERSTMTDLTALRLYLPHAARAKPTRFWHKLSAPVLSHRLLRAAHHQGIHQVILHAVHAGYLPGRALSHRHVETICPEHPLCIELINSEARLRDFLKTHEEDLDGVQAVLFRCELAL